MKQFLYLSLAVFFGNCLVNRLDAQSVKPPDTTTAITITLFTGASLADGQFQSLPVEVSFTSGMPQDKKDSSKLSPAQIQGLLKKQFYPLLLKSLKRTIDSLNDSRTGLRDFYTAVFGDKYQAMRDELDKLAEHFGPKRTAYPEDDFIKNVDNAIANIHPQYFVEAHYRGSRSLMEYDVYLDDPVKLFLKAYLATCTDPFTELQKKGEFYTDELNLEKALEAALKLKNQPLACPSAGPTREDQARHINASVSDNPIFSVFFEHQDCIKMLFWLSDGSFRSRAMLPSAKYDWRKVFLFNRIIQQKVDSLKKCCENDPVKIEALIKAINSGKNRFKLSGNMLLGYKEAAALGQSRSFVNQVLVPVLLKKNCCAPGYASPYVKKWVISYDASKDYITAQPCLKPAVPEDEQVIIAVNNVPAGKGLLITGTDVTIPDQSKAQSALADIGTGLSGAAASITPLSGLIASAFPPQVPANTQVDIQQVTSGHLAIAPEQFFTLTLNNTTFHFPGKVSKRAILDAYIQDGRVAQYDTLRKEADYYLANCNPPDIDQRNKYRAKITMEALVKAFKSFLEFNTADSGDADDLNVNITKLNFLLSSLGETPAADPEKSVVPDKPALRTVLSTFDYVKGPKEKDYILTEEVAKPVKVAAAAKPATEPGPADSIKTNVLKGRFLVGKRYLVQVSAGLGVTTRDYSENQPSFSSGQLAVNQLDEQASFLIGLNFYPFKIFNLDNNFMGLKTPRVLTSRWQNRLSLYTGIGIPDPLHNYYAGISDDLLPGIKLTVGAHFLIYTKYQVTNDAITDQAAGFKAVGPFVGFSLDANFVGKLFSLFK